MHLKDVDFYQFFKKNSQVQGFFLPKAVFIKTSNLMFNKKLLNYKFSFFGGLNFPVIDKTWTFEDNLKLSNKKFYKKANWNKTDVCHKNIVTIHFNLFGLCYNLYIFDGIFMLYLNFLKEVYSFLILMVLLRA